MWSDQVEVNIGKELKTTRPIIIPLNINEINRPKIFLHSMAYFHSGPGSSSDVSWETTEVGKNDLYNCLKKHLYGCFLVTHMHLMFYRYF